MTNPSDLREKNVREEYEAARLDEPVAELTEAVVTETDGEHLFVNRAVFLPGGFVALVYPGGTEIKPREEIRNVRVNAYPEDGNGE